MTEQTVEFPPRPTQRRCRAKTHAQLCLTCGQPAWKKHVSRRRGYFYCPDCRVYFTVRKEAPQLNEGNKKWRALSNEGDNHEWEGTIAQLFAHLNSLDRMQHDLNMRRLGL